MTLELTTRNAELGDLAALLTEQQAHKVDLVAPASALHMRGGRLVVRGVEPILTETGVLPGDGEYELMGVAEAGLAEKLAIPLDYMRRMREGFITLYDDTVNGWLHGDGTGRDEPPWRGPDDRRFLIRAFQGDEGGGVVRAVLSDTYKPIDYLDALTAALDGIAQSGARVRIVKCNLTERRLYVHIESEDVAALAPRLLHDYRSPFTGARGADNPQVFAGFVLTDSEVGHGAFRLTPRIIIRICGNGATFSKDALASIHLGTKLESGIVRTSQDTVEKQLALVTAQARDAVTTFMDHAYVEAKIREIEEQAGIPIPGDEAAAVVEHVGKALRFTEAQTKSVLGMFIKGGDVSTGGVFQAVTASAQAQEDADLAHKMEGQAVEAMALAAARVR